MLLAIAPALLALPAALGAPPVAFTLVEEDRTYQVQPGDSLADIALRLGIPWRRIADLNGLADPTRIAPGQVLRLPAQRIVPAVLQDGLVINVPERTLYHFAKGVLIASYPVGVGRPDWPTPLGEFRITAKVKNPAWSVPKSIQEEMAAEEQVVKTQVEPGPDNPLGEYWLRLSLPGYGIHGTIAPESVGWFGTHGCVRLRAEDIESLYHALPERARVLIIYEPVKLAAAADGRVFLEVHPDPYGITGDAFARFGEVLAARPVPVPLDYAKVQAALWAADGFPRLVGGPIRQPGDAR
jgi:L,D-transpeptidase ErfK/SrfK